MTKEYHGYYDVKVHEAVVTVKEDSKTKPLDPRLDLINHSPTGFAWGYAGSGPSQLAFAILADFFIGANREGMNDRLKHHLEQTAERLHQDFKWEVIAKLNKDTPWTLTEKQIRDWLITKGEIQ